MKNLFIYLFICSSLLFAAKERGNGGEYIVIDGQPRLVDLLIGNDEICRWVKAKDLVKDMIYFNKALSELEKVHWYFSNSMSLEANKISICFTRHKINSLGEGEAGYPISLANGGQLAVRTGANVFIAETIYEQMPVVDKEYLFIHETLHSYLPQDTKLRKEKVQKMTKAIYENASTLKTPEEFAELIREGGFILPQYAFEINSDTELFVELYRKLAHENLSFCERHKLAKEMKDLYYNLSLKDKIRENDYIEILGLAQFPALELANIFKEHNLASFIDFMSSCQIDPNEEFVYPFTEEMELLVPDNINTFGLAIVLGYEDFFDFMFDLENIDINKVILCPPNSRAAFGPYQTNPFILAIVNYRWNIAKKLVLDENFDSNFNINLKGYTDQQQALQVVVRAISDLPANDFSAETEIAYSALFDIFKILVEDTVLDINRKLENKYHYPIFSWILRIFHDAWHDSWRYLLFREILKRQDLNINYIEEDSNVWSFSYEGNTMGGKVSPLMFLTQQGLFDEIKLLFNERSDLDPNLTNKAKDDALWYAIERSIKTGESAILEFFISNQRVNLNNNIMSDGHTALMRLARLEGDNVKELDLLIKSGRVNTKLKGCFPYKGKTKCYTAYKWAKLLGNNKIRTYLKSIK